MIRSYWNLVIDDPSIESVELEALPRFEENLMSISDELKLLNYWYHNFETTTRHDYIESKEIVGEEPDDEEALKYPEEKQFYFNHDDLIQPLYGLLLHFEENRDEMIAEYIEENEDFPDQEDEWDDIEIRKPENLDLVISEIKLMLKVLEAARASNTGFYLHVWVDY